MNWIWTIGAPLVRAIMGMLFHMRIECAGSVPRSGPVILAPNHISVLDGPAVSEGGARSAAAAPLGRRLAIVAMAVVWALALGGAVAYFFGRDGSTA